MDPFLPLNSSTGHQKGNQIIERIDLDFNHATVFHVRPNRIYQSICYITAAKQTLAKNINPNFLSPRIDEDREIFRSASPEIPQGILILNKIAPFDVYTCRFCKTLVSGKIYRGKEIKGFDTFSEHMIDFHQKIVLVSSHLSENKYKGVLMAKSTG